MLNSKHEKVKQKGEQLLELFPQGMTFAYYNIEKVYDKEFAKQIGVDLEKLHVIEGCQIEETGTKLEAALPVIHGHIIDSTSAAFSVDEINSDISDWHRAIKARAWSKVLDHIQERIDANENVVVFLDQIRIDQMTGAGKPPGGEKLEHASSMSIQLKRGKWLNKNKQGFLDEAGDKTNTLTKQAEADGYEIQARVVKSRVGRPFRTARIHVDFEDMSFDTDYELIKCASYFDIVEQAGSWFTLPDGTKVQGENGLREAINENVQLKQEIQDSIANIICLNP